MTIDQRRLRAYEGFRSWLALLATRHSLRVIAHRAGLNHSTVARLITTPQQPTLDTAQKLISAWIR